MKCSAKKRHLRISCLIESCSEFFFEANQVSSFKINLFNFRKIDIFIGALDENILTKEYFDASHSYYYDSLTWCVRQRQPIAKWKNFFRLCRDPTVYTIYTIMSISVVFTCYFMQQYEFLQPKWDGLSILLMAIANVCGSGSNYKPKIASHRIFFIIGVLGGILLNIILTSFTVIFMSNQIFGNQIESIQEIVENRFDLVGDGFALQQLNRNKQVILY